MKKLKKTIDFLSNNFKKKRYFLIFYKCNILVGECDIFTTGGVFPSRSELINKITYLCKKDNIGVADVVITNIIEISEEDHKNWKS